MSRSGHRQIKAKSSTGRGFESEDAIVTVGAYRPLDDCLRIAPHRISRLDSQ